MRFDLARDIPVHQRGKAVGHDRGADFEQPSPIQTHHAEVFDQKVVGLDLWNGAAGKADG